MSSTAATPVPALARVSVLRTRSVFAVGLIVLVVLGTPSIAAVRAVPDPTVVAEGPPVPSAGVGLVAPGFVSKIELPCHGVPIVGAGQPSVLVGDGNLVRVLVERTTASFARVFIPIRFR